MPRTKTKSPFATIEQILDELKLGRIVIITDDESRENEGDLLCSAALTTAEHITFMATHGRGLICVPITAQRATQLGLQHMVAENKESFKTAFTVSVDAAKGVTTGISAPDRAKAVRVLAAAKSKPGDLVQPGHIFPLVAKAGGVLQRAGHTEAAVDLMKLAGLDPAGVICEVMKDDGSMARLPDLVSFARKHDLKIASIQDLIQYRRRTEKLVVREQTVKMPTAFGEFDLTLYHSLSDGQHHIALTKGKISARTPVLVRVHSECLTGDVFGSCRCDCGTQLHLALQRIEQEGAGVLLYMRQEGRGIGIAAKIHAYKLQEAGYDTVEANVKLGYPSDLREYGVGAQILFDLGVRRIRLLTNNPKKVVGLEGYGLVITEQIPIKVAPNPHNKKYLDTKRKKMGHMI